MVQNKQKSNKINITATITCFMLIMVFVFGCVKYAYAADEVKWWRTADLKYGDDVLNLFKSNNTSYEKYTVVAWIVGSDNSYATTLVISDLDTTKRIALYENNSSSRWNFGILGEQNTFVNNDLHNLARLSSELKDDYYDNINGSGSNYGSITLDDSQALWTSVSAHTYGANYPVFKTKEDCQNYIDTGDMSNAVYVPKVPVEYDSDIEVPLNLDIRLNGNSDFVPNVKISCNQTEQIENRYLEVQYSIGYKATWKLLGGIGLNVKSKTSPTVYGSIEQLEDSFDNGGTSFETILSLSKLSHSIAPDKEAFSKYEPTPKVYWSLKEIKNDNSEMKIWCRNRVGNKASKWIMVSGDGYKANFDVVDSDENGNPTDLKDDTANSETGYGSDYWNNRDNTPQEDYSSTDVKNNLKDLKNNYTNLANFFKELFGFLPTEIWIILIGLVSTMAIIAIVIFVRG